jgi:hypothetical protein
MLADVEKHAAVVISADVPVAFKLACLGAQTFT